MTIYGHLREASQDHIWSYVKKDEDQQVFEKICHQLRTMRINQGISQQRLAEMAGISRTGLRHVESGQISPTLYILLKIARSLNCSLSKILDKGG